MKKFTKIAFAAWVVAAGSGLIYADTTTTITVTTIRSDAPIYMRPANVAFL